jgi:hypothetical protein
MAFDVFQKRALHEWRSSAPPALIERRRRPAIAEIVEIHHLSRRLAPARTTSFDPALHLSIQAHAAREPGVGVQHVALKPVTTVVGDLRAPFLVLEPLVFLPHLTAY